MLSDNINKLEKQMLENLTKYIGELWANEENKIS